MVGRRRDRRIAGSRRRKAPHPGAVLRGAGPHPQPAVPPAFSLSCLRCTPRRSPRSLGLCSPSHAAHAARWQVPTATFKLHATRRSRRSATLLGYARSPLASPPAAAAPMGVPSHGGVGAVAAAVAATLWPRPGHRRVATASARHTAPMADALATPRATQALSPCATGASWPTPPTPHAPSAPLETLSYPISLILLSLLRASASTRHECGLVARYFACDVCGARP